MSSPFTPIVGQKYELLSWAPSAVIRCKCLPTGDGPIMLLAGAGPHVCALCGTVWSIAGVDWKIGQPVALVQIAYGTAQRKDS